MPEVVALIGSPYQALGLLEYVHDAGIESGLVFINRQRDPAMMTPTFNTLAHLRGFTFRFRPAGGFGKPAETTADVARELADIATAEVPDATLVIGDYRETLGWRLARNLDRDGDQIVILDDGLATLAIDRQDGGVAPLEWSEEADAGGFLPTQAVTFFTAFSRSLKAGPKDVVRQNDWAHLKSTYRALKRSTSVTLVVGQGMARAGLIDDESELAFARDLIDRARQLHPHSSLIYASHRGERPEKLAALAELCDVVRFDVPLELVPVDTGWLPAGIIGHVSTALTSFAELVPPGLPIHSVRLPAERFHIRQEHIAEAYRRLEDDYAGVITVVD